MGAITNHETRQLTISADFLREGNYDVDIYTDAPDARQNPNHLAKQTRAVNNKDKIAIELASGGGMVMHVRRN